jgi:glycosyltransferase involved in cell wall biosynthesis
MKIALFTCSVSRSAGGLMAAVRDLYIAMQPYGSTVIYTYVDEHTRDDLSSWEDLEITLYRKTNPFFYSSEVKIDLLKSDSDLLHIHGLWRYPHAFATRWKEQTKKPVIVTAHGMLDPYIIRNQGIVKRFLGNLFFARTAFKNIDCYHALCQAELEVIRAYGIKKPIAIIPNGVNMPDESKKYETFDDKRHLLFLGRLHPKKGTDMFIEAIGLIKEENADLLEGWVFDIVGWVQEGFDQKLNTIIDKYDIADYVKFHGGLFAEAKERVYATAHGYILPSHGEGLPMTVLEAWSWGLPVIMTPQCNIPEGFTHGAAIRIENNVDSVKEGISRFLYMSTDKQKEMGKKGKELVLSEFTWQLSAKKMSDLYLWMLGAISKPDFVNNEI